jgi:hypothetical protein
MTGDELLCQVRELADTLMAAAMPRRSCLIRGL